MFRNFEGEDAIGGEADAVIVFLPRWRGVAISTYLFHILISITPNGAGRLLLWRIAATGVILQLLTLAGIAWSCLPNRNKSIMSQRCYNNFAASFPSSHVS